MSSTIKSDNSDLTINADGSNEIKFQANGVEKASISSAGAFTSTTIDATALTGALPAIDGSSLTGLTSAQMPTGSTLQVVGTTGLTSGHESDTSESPVTSVYNSQAITIKGGTSSKVLIFIYCGSQINNGDSIGTSWCQRAITGGATTQINDTKYSYIGGNQFTSTTQMYIDTPNVAAGTVVTYSGRYNRFSGSSTFYYLHQNHGYGISVMEIAG